MQGGIIAALPLAWFLLATVWTPLPDVLHIAAWALHWVLHLFLYLACLVPSHYSCIAPNIWTCCICIHLSGLLLIGAVVLWLLSVALVLLSPTLAAVVAWQMFSSNFAHAQLLATTAIHQMFRSNFATICPTTGLSFERFQKNSVEKRSKNWKFRKFQLPTVKVANTTVTS